MGSGKLQFRAAVSKEATVHIIQRICRTTATPGDESVKKKQSETEKAGQERRSRRWRDGTGGGVTGHS